MTRKKDGAVTAADSQSLDVKFSETLLKLDSEQAQHLIGKFARVYGIASGAFVDTKLLYHNARLPQLPASRRPETPITAGQYGKLMEEFSRARHRESARDIDNLTRNAHMIIDVANGLYDDVVVAADGRVVVIDYAKTVAERHDEVGFQRGDAEIAHLDAVLRFPSSRHERTSQAAVMLVGFCGGVSSPAVMEDRLRQLNLRAATADHLIAYAEKTHAQLLQKHNVKCVVAPGSVAQLYRKNIYAMALVHDVDRGRVTWRLDHVWHAEGKQGERAFIGCASYGEWVLAVQEERFY